jgi:hypothetical protein
MFGGTVFTVKHSRPDYRRPVYRWNVQGPKAKVALAEMIGYLGLKKPQAFEALKVVMVGRGHVRGPELRAYDTVLAERITTLKRVG